jgi:xanthine phosphoribosyltransferase
LSLIFFVGSELAEAFKDSGVTLVLTAQTSGVLPAQACALHLKVPMVFARESRPLTMKDADVYMAESASHTRTGKKVILHVSTEFLKSTDKVVIVDDFLATGTTAVRLMQICDQAGAQVVGLGFLIDKEFEHGRDTVLEHIKSKNIDVPVVTLATVLQLNENETEEKAIVLQ